MLTKDVEETVGVKGWFVSFHSFAELLSVVGSAKTEYRRPDAERDFGGTSAARQDQERQDWRKQLDEVLLRPSGPIPKQQQIPRTHLYHLESVETATESKNSLSNKSSDSPFPNPGSTGVLDWTLPSPSAASLDLSAVRRLFSFSSVDLHRWGWGFDAVGLFRPRVSACFCSTSSDWCDESRE